MFKKKKERKYIGILVIHDSDNTFTILKCISISPMNDTIEFEIDGNKKPYVIDFSYPTYIKNNTHYYMVEKNTGQILLSESNNNIIDSEMLDDIINKHIIRDLAKATSEKKKDWFSLLSFLTIGALLGFIAGFLTMYFIGG